MSYRADKLKNEVNRDFEVKFDLEGQGQSPPKTIGILTKVFYIFVPNLVILVWTGDELSRGQASAYRIHRRTDGHTDRQTQATTMPEGQNWPRVIIYAACWSILIKTKIICKLPRYLTYCLIRILIMWGHMV